MDKNNVKRTWLTFTTHISLTSKYNLAMLAHRNVDSKLLNPFNS